MCMANVPEYVEYLKDCSFESVFKWHKRFFQVLEINGSPKRWLLKDPSHIGHIPEILSTYPNAKFINIHRSLYGINCIILQPCKKILDLHSQKMLILSRLVM